MSAVTIPLGLFTHWCVAGRIEAASELLIWSTTIAFPLAAFTLGSFLWNMFLAPARIDREQQKEIAALSARPTEETYRDSESRLSAVEQERDALALEKRERLDKRVKREAISAFIKRGQELFARASEEPQPIEEHNAWVTDLREYLERELDVSYVVRLDDFSGLTFYGGDKFTKSVDGRVRRLHEFLAELSD